MPILIKQYRMLLTYLLIMLYVPPVTGETELKFVSAQVDGVEDVEGLTGASAVTVGGENGEHIYVAGFFANAVAVFNRDPQTGQITFLQAVKNNVNDIKGLQGATALALSPDHKHLYVAGSGDDAIVVFTRHLTSGLLTLVEIQQDGIKGVETLAGASDVTVSPDGTYVYVTAPRDQAVTAFQRNANTGVLTPLHSQTAVNGLQGAIGVAVSRDNAFVYVAASRDNAVSVFTKELAFIGTYRHEIEVPNGLSGAYQLVISPDNHHLYAIGNTNNSIVSFRRDLTLGTLTYLQTLQDGVGDVEGLAGARDVAINPNGAEVYVASANDNAFALFTRDATSGLLTFAHVFQQGHANVDYLSGVTAVTTNSTGTEIYTAALFSNALSEYGAAATDLAIEMDDVTTVAINSPLTYRLTVKNGGTLSASHVVVNDELPANTTYVSAITSEGQNCTYSIETHTVSCVLGALAVDAPVSITLTITTPSEIGTGRITNRATVSSTPTDTQSANNTVEKSTTLLAELIATDLQLAATVEPADTVALNSPLTYRLTVTNAGPEIAHNTTVISTLPTGSTFISATEEGGEPCTHEAGVVTCMLGDGQVEAVGTITLQITSPATEGVMTFTSQISASEIELTPADNAVNIQTPVSTVTTVDLAVMDVLATPSSVNVGDGITVTLEIANNGDTKAEGVIVKALLPVQVSYLSDDKGCTHDNGQLTCQIGILEEKTATNSVQQISVQLTATAPTQPPGQPAESVPLTVTITGSGADTNGDNNNGNAELIITGALADFVVSITEKENAVLVNTPITLTLTAHNNGPNAAGATLNGLITGENVIINNITATNGVCTSSMTFNCTLNSINASESQTITLDITPTTVGTLTLRADLLGEGLDPTHPNTATTEVAVTDKQANLGVTLNSKPEIGATNRELIYTATVTNSGPSQATGVKITQQLPSGSTFVSAQASQGDTCTQADQTVTCILGPLGLEETATLLVTITPNIAGTLNSGVRVQSHLFDSDQTNNSATLETQVTETTTDLSVTLTSAPNPTVIDGELTYTIQIESVGEESTGVTLTHTLPERTLFLTARVLPENGGQCTRTSDSQALTCRFEVIRPTTPITVSVAVQPIAAGELTSTVTVIGQAFDTDESNNTATAITQVNNLAALFFMSSVRNGSNGIQGLEGITAVEVSPDGQHVYATGFTNNALAVFKRDANDGSLSFVQVVIDGTNDVEGLAGANDVQLSPDGNTVYVSGFNDSAVAAFSRDRVNGTLTFLAAYKEGLDGVDGLSGAYALAVTANHLYVAGLNADAIVIFSRLADGRLRFESAQRAGSLDAVNALALSAEGSFLYVASANSDSLTVFGRETTTGNLTWVQTEFGLEGANGVAISPDGLHVFVTSGGNNALSVFNRDAVRGQVTFAQVLRDGSDGISGLLGVDGVAVSPDGSTVYTVAQQAHTLSMFRRDALGLSFVDSLRNGVEGVSGLGGARDLALNPSGETIYVAGFSDQAIGIVQVAHADLSLAIRDNRDPVNVGDNITYTLTVTNNGPHPARAVVLNGRVPQGLKALSFTPSQGECTLVGGQIDCALGTLEVKATATLTLIVTANRLGEVEIQATVGALQFDPSAPNRAVETTQVVATADVNLVISAKPSLVMVDSLMELLVILTNYGPDTAEQLVLTSELPPQMRFNAVQVGGNPVEFCQWHSETSTVVCTLSTLESGASLTVSLLVETVSEGVVAVNTAVTSAAFDPELSNNNASQSIEITLKIIRQTHNNEGQTLENYIVASGGAVIGGALAGQIVNEGHLSNVWITPNTLVAGGGELSGKITNEGIIDSAKFRAGTVVTGGVLQGVITGSAIEPATINALVEAGTTLEQVIIAFGSEVHASAILGEGVRFTANQTIPSGIDLTGALPFIVEPIGQRTAVNLLYDVLLNGDNLLTQINALPDLKQNGIAFYQDPVSGNLLLPLGDELVVLVPMSVHQTERDSGIYVLPDGQVEFVTDAGRLIIAPPALQDASALQSVLSELELLGFSTQSDGSLKVDANDTLYFSARPHHKTQIIESFIPLGLFAVSSPLTGNLVQYVLRYVDQEGVRRQQFLYPTAAHHAALQETLLALPGASEVSFQSNGSVSVKIRERMYTAVFDYQVQMGTPSSLLQLLTIPDQNGDESEDIRVVYRSGEQQVAYLLPLPNWITEIQAIPAIQATNTLAVTDDSAHLRLLRGSTWQLMKAITIEYLTEAAVPSATFFADGRARFVIESGREVLTQPLVQDVDALNAELALLNLPVASIDEERGLLWVSIDNNLGFQARPALDSTLAVLTRPLGLNSIPTFLPGVAHVLLVFRDETGSKRQQFLYPAAKSPESLYEFFMSIPTITSVVFYNNGQIVVSDGVSEWKGLLAYAVVADSVATGGIQFTAIADQNGDGIGDFEVVYADGSRQVIYQVP